MAELVCDIPLDPPLERLRLAHLPADKILDLFSELEFTLLTRRFREFFDTAYGRTIFDIDALPKIQQTPTSKNDQLSLF